MTWIFLTTLKDYEEGEDEEMQYALQIREHNRQAHTDIEEDIQERRNGLFTFTLRVNGGNIVDYNLTEYVNARNKYGGIKKVIVQELTVTYNRGK